MTENGPLGKAGGFPTPDDAVSWGVLALGILTGILLGVVTVLTALAARGAHP